MPFDEIARLSLQTAQRALDLQERTVEQLRSRTSALLTASSLIASFFGSETIKRSNGLGPFGALGLLTMTASIGLCVYVLIPKQRFIFVLDAQDLYRRLHDARSDTAVDERLIDWLAGCRSENEVELSTLNRVYFAAAICLMLQLASWAIAFVVTLR